MIDYRFHEGLIYRGQQVVGTYWCILGVYLLTHTLSERRCIALGRSNALDWVMDDTHYGYRWL